MIATVKGLGLFPPSPQPEGISEEDCCYQDASAPLPVISQRLYNDHVRRQRDDCSSGRLLQRRSMTAAFLVEFAYEAGATLPPVPDTYETLLQEFTARTAEFNEEIAHPEKATPPVPSEHDVVEEEKENVPAKQTSES